MKKFISIIFFICIIGSIYYYKEDITKYVVDDFIYKKNIIIPDSNEYKRNYDFSYIKETDNFYPKNKQELYNVFYTILNNGYNNFTFYCDDEYKSCEKDVSDLTNDNDQVLSYINNYVSPYNSYSSISVNINNLGRISVDADIYLLNSFITKLYKGLINDTMTDEQKIKTIHDYIINNAVYDKTWVTTESANRIHKSNTAYGPLLEKIGLCGGYTDAMALFLDIMNIKNYKIASDNHVWNYVYINNSWKHLDLTWDDPVTNTGKNILQYDYYLINTKQLEAKKDNEHTYSKDVYIEAK